MFDKLNGWQRLWVVFSVFLFVVFAFVTYFYFPQWSRPPEAPPEGFSSQTEIYPAECAWIEDLFVKQWHKSHALKEFLDPDLVYDDPEYKACRNRVILKKKVMVVVEVFSVWLASIIFIYGAGFSVAWVRSGFRRKKDS